MDCLGLIDNIELFDTSFTIYGHYCMTLINDMMLINNNLTSSATKNKDIWYVLRCYFFNKEMKKYRALQKHIYWNCNALSEEDLLIPDYFKTDKTALVTGFK